MANLSQFLVNPFQGPRTGTPNSPGSNGYWRRKAYGLPGAYRFVAPRTGRYKFAGIGGGSGGKGSTGTAVVLAGSGGGLGIGEFDLVKGDVGLITVAAGGLGVAASGTPSDGGTTTIVCAARGINMVIPGGRFSTANIRPTGGNVANNVGGNAVAGVLGGASSGTPFGDGFPANGTGGSGWGGPSSTGDGTSSNTLGRSPYDEALNEIRNFSNPSWWDLEDVVGVGGSSGGSANPGGAGGPGAGGGEVNTTNSGNTGGTGGLGGGGGTATATASGAANNGGNGGAGGGGGVGNRSGIGGNGGNGYVLIHFDEVI